MVYALLFLSEYIGTSDIRDATYGIYGMIHINKVIMRPSW